MRSAAAALSYSVSNPTIPYLTVSGIDGRTREVGDLECARSVMADYDVMPIDDMGTANRMWQRTVYKNDPDVEPNLGAPVYFPNPRASSSGHVALYAGNGYAYTTPVWLHGDGAYQDKELITVSDLALKCGNAYAGWGGDIAGQLIDFTTTADSGARPAPTTGQDDNMAFIFGHGTDAGGYLCTLIDTSNATYLHARTKVEANALARYVGRNASDWSTNGPNGNDFANALSLGERLARRKLTAV